MPLTSFQAQLAKLLASNKSEDSHLAGGAAIHLKPNSLRFSMDLDYFHDSEKRVSTAYEADRELLQINGFNCSVEMRQPGYIRCIVSKTSDATKIEWAQDSSWRFLPVQVDQDVGYILHPLDLAINKLLALVGRDEVRDFLDVHYTHQNTLPLGAQIWAACGKDPGFTPLSMLELLKRRGKYHAQDFSRLNLVKPIDLVELKQEWLKMLEAAEDFVRRAPPDDLGCLYFSQQKNCFFEPKDFTGSTDYVKQFGEPGGVLPKII